MANLHRKVVLRPEKTIVSVLCVILGAAAVNSLAQNAAPTATPSRSKIAGLLSSGDPRLVAWGAHYALQTKDRSLEPDLLSLAEAWKPLAESGSEDKSGALAVDQLDQRDAMAATLDALIQMHASVDLRTLNNLTGDLPNQVAILLVRLPLQETQSLDLEFYHSDPQTHGERDLKYVSAVLLAQAPPGGFAADLLSSIHTRVTITITSPTPGTESMYGTGIGDSCFAAGSHKDWPQFGIYELSENKLEGGFVLISGSNPVYAHRSETNHYRGDACDNFTFLVLGPEQRRSLIAHMLSIPQDDIEWQIETQDKIEFKSDEQFYRELQDFIAAEQEKYRKTASALVEKNLMTASEQEESLPHLDLAFKDQRGAGYSPIPAPASLPPHVIWPDHPNNTQSSLPSKSGS